MKARPTQSREGVKGGSPLQGAGTASLLGFGATPQLFLVQPTQKENSSGATLVAGSEASLRSNFARPQTRLQAAFSTKIKNRLPTPITA